jgi:hypothetical protein
VIFSQPKPRLLLVLSPPLVWEGHGGGSSGSRPRPNPHKLQRHNTNISLGEQG